MPYFLRVSPLINRVIEIQEVCRACTLTIVRYNFIFDLILVDMVDFNNIVGMEWFTTFKAHNVFYWMEVTFRLPNRVTLKFVDDGRWLPIPSLMESVLASLWAEGVGDIVSELSFMVFEYPYMFPISY